MLLLIHNKGQRDNSMGKIVKKKYCSYSQEKTFVIKKIITITKLLKG